MCQYKATKQIPPTSTFAAQHGDLHISNGVSQYTQHFTPGEFTSALSNPANNQWLPSVRRTAVENAQQIRLPPIIRPLRIQHYRLYRRTVRLRRIVENDENEHLKSVTLDVNIKSTSQDDMQTLNAMRRPPDEHLKRSTKAPTPEAVRSSPSNYKRLYKSILKPFALAIRKLLVLWQRSNINNSNRNMINSHGVKTSKAEIVDPRSAYAISHCNGCPPNAGADISATFTALLKNAFNLKKLSHLALSLRSLRVHSTTNDQAIEFKGEFSPGGNGGTPFGPFPLNFPQPIGHRMIEVLISDFTLNSLLY
uniref:Uncharacterized protein n=1 Tax=Parascaris univalens TaxID=6257 RepID=A0A915AYN4_PARUN